MSDSAKKEAQDILRLTEQNTLKALEIIERQLFVLYTRAQVLVSLAGVVITVTGFSGRKIAGTSLPAQLLIIGGLATVLGCVIWIYMKVMKISWATSALSEDPVECLVKLIERRNKKTRAYLLGGYILFIGLALYCMSVSLMLLSPGD